MKDGARVISLMREEAQLKASERAISHVTMERDAFHLEKDALTAQVRAMEAAHEEELRYLRQLVEAGHATEPAYSTPQSKPTHSPPKSSPPPPHTVTPFVTPTAAGQLQPTAGGAKFISVPASAVGSASPTCKSGCSLQTSAHASGHGWGGVSSSPPLANDVQANQVPIREWSTSDMEA